MNVPTRRISTLTLVLALSAATPAAPAAGSSAPSTETVRVAAAGDIAHCGSGGDEKTAELIDELQPDLVLALGDLAYDSGTPTEFAECYEPTWGRHRGITRPAPGNHEYGTPGAAGYFDYFGSSVGVRSEGYYSFDAGQWHIVVLNTNCGEIGGCGRDSAQGRWLAADLAANASSCVLATSHHPRFSSGRYGANNAIRPLWELLAEGGADVMLTGHEHSYERFAPQTEAGVAHPDGIRQFVVGTGGVWLRPFEEIAANSERRIVSHGILSLELSPGKYAWDFRDVTNTSLDSGIGSCGPPTDDEPVRTLVRRVAAGSDDVEERQTGVMYFGSTDIELIRDSDDQAVGLRFRNVGLPPGASVLSAHIQFTVDEVGDTPTRLAIGADASGDPAVFQPISGDVRRRKSTTASVTWDVPPWKTIGEASAAQRTPDLSDIVRELVTNPRWEMGDAMVFLINGVGRRTAESFEGDPSRAAALEIAYVDGSTSPGDPPDREPEPPIGGRTDVVVSAGIDDAEELRSSGTVTLRSSDLELIAERHRQFVGIRFAKVDVPVDATIDRAHIQFTADETEHRSATLDIRGEASDAAAPFAALPRDISSRPRTSSRVEWSPPPWSVVGESGAIQRTPDLTSIVREIVGRPGWSRGSPMAFVFEGWGRRTAEAFEGDAARAARLVIEWTVPSAPSG